MFRPTRRGVYAELALFPSIRARTTALVVIAAVAGHLVVVIGLVQRVACPLARPRGVGLDWLMGPGRRRWEGDRCSTEGLVLAQLVEEALVTDDGRRRHGQHPRPSQSQEREEERAHDVERHAVPPLLGPPDSLLKRPPLREHDEAADDRGREGDPPTAVDEDGPAAGDRARDPVTRRGEEPDQVLVLRAAACQRGVGAERVSKVAEGRGSARERSGYASERLI